MKRELRDYVQDVIDAMQKSMNFVKDMSYEEFTKDDKTSFAVIRALEIIGEAVKNIPRNFRKKYPEIPWSEMAEMRNKLIHEYFGIRLDIVWRTIKDEIAPLKPLFEKMLKDLEKLKGNCN